MAFSWKNCTVLYGKNSRPKCFEAINTFAYCLTPRVTNSLNMWLTYKVNKFGKDKIVKEEVEEDIAELLRKCCNIEKVALIMCRDVEKVEDELILYIRKAKECHRLRGLYSMNIELETKEEYNRRQQVNDEYIDKYLKGVVILD